MEVFAPPGTLVGTVEEEWSIISRKFIIRNASGDVVFRIKGPFCICGYAEFKVSKLNLIKFGKRILGKNFGVISSRGEWQ